MQHGGQVANIPLLQPKVQAPTQQLLPYTVDSGDTQYPHQPHPITLNKPLPSQLPIASTSIPSPVRIPDESQAGNIQRHKEQPRFCTQWASAHETREKSKSITEREIGTVQPALAGDGEEAIPSEQDPALPEPKSPFYPARNAPLGTKLSPVFPPVSSWTPVESPIVAPSVPLSAIQAAVAGTGADFTPRLGMDTHVTGISKPYRIQIEQANRQRPSIKLQHYEQIPTQQLQQALDRVGLNDCRLQSGSFNEELSAAQLRAPESASGIFGGLGPSAVMTEDADSTGIHLVIVYILSRAPNLLHRQVDSEFSVIHGEYRFADGSQFKGKYENNKKHGLGEALYKNGRDTGEGEAGTSGDARYIGHFVGGQRQPYGTLIYSNGDVYEGEWFAGQKHGEGSYRFCSDGSILSGSWEAGWLKKGRWILPTGAVYIGEFVLNKPNGRGAWLIPSGNQVLVEYTQQTKKTSDQTGNEEGSADEEGIAKYEIAKIDVQYICTVTTRE
ncbi:hypothetical protein cyc_03243 [Cyclospora cayetanensis]|uniref:Uncharacterized protein n=1 Tax=Cyclospora cayetanensis TaxID=88456 RepID=A0A1D3D7H1_9EIME|nr:hypothetical protein cyc_03243 [Cyclospora cayetanensis]